jgi:hypothetical protein
VRSGAGAKAAVRSWAKAAGFLKLSRALKLITQRRSFCGGSLLLSGRVIHLDGDSLILEPHSSGHHVPAFLGCNGVSGLVAAVSGPLGGCASD